MLTHLNAQTSLNFWVWSDRGFRTPSFQGPVSGEIEFPNQGSVTAHNSCTWLAASGGKWPMSKGCKWPAAWRARPRRNRFYRFPASATEKPRMTKRNRTP